VLPPADSLLEQAEAIKGDWRTVDVVTSHVDAVGPSARPIVVVTHHHLADGLRFKVSVYRDSV